MFKNQIKTNAADEITIRTVRTGMRYGDPFLVHIQRKVELDNAMKKYLWIFII